MTTKLTTESIREIWSKATPGPWKFVRISGHVRAEYPLGDVIGPDAWPDGDDGRAIAAAPEHIAFLLADNAALKQERDIARGHVDEAREQLAAANKRIAELEKAATEVIENPRSLDWYISELKEVLRK